jgi:tetratricopeptide (TPR) repeat protein
MFVSQNIMAQSNEENRQKDVEKSSSYFQKASELFDQQSYLQAKQYCDSAIVYNTENMQAYAFRGVCKYNLKDYPSAIEDFDLALVLEKGYAEVYYYRGLCKKELGFDKLACDDWYEAYELGFKKVIKIIESNCELALPVESPDGN